MRKLGVFNLITVDGYFTGQAGDISWHNVDDEFQEYARQVSNSGHLLLFGRVTYDLMASYWPSPEGLRDDPVVARGMNSSPKIVFSRTMHEANWANTRLVKDDMAREVRRLKQQPGPDMTILGSGSIVAQLTHEHLIDEYHMLLNPIALGKGRTMFEGIPEKLMLTLFASRTFGNGNVLLSYTPLNKGTD